MTVDQDAICEHLANSKSLVEIYGLFDPVTNELRYVGKAKNSAKRFAGHMKEKRRKTPVYDWIKSLNRMGLFPLMKVIVTTNECNWEFVEKEVIKQYKSVRLLNIALGGDEPFCPTSVRAENGRKVAFKIHNDPEAKRIWKLKQDVGLALKKGYVSESSKNKLRIAAQKAPHLFGEYGSI